MVAVKYTARHFIIRVWRTQKQRSRFGSRHAFATLETTFKHANIIDDVFRVPVRKPPPLYVAPPLTDVFLNRRTKIGVIYNNCVRCTYSCALICPTVISVVQSRSLHGRRFSTTRQTYFFHGETIQLITIGTANNERIRLAIVSLSGDAYE